MTISLFNLESLGASFNNFLDAIDGDYCTFEGGDDPTQDGVYPDTQPGGYDRMKSLMDVFLELTSLTRS